MHNHNSQQPYTMDQFLNQVTPIVDQAAQLSQQNSPVLDQKIQRMPEMAMVLSKYFLSLSKYCLTHYHSMVKQQKRTREHRNRGLNQERSGLALKDPKQPKTAYILYFGERVPEFKEKHPTCSYPELTCLIAQEWKNLPESDKEPYVQRATDDRKRYQRERKERLTRRKKAAEEESNEEESVEEGQQGEEEEGI